MSYKYDPQNGYRNADQLNADVESYNEILYKLISAIKKTKDVRSAMNMVSSFLKGMEDYQEYMNNKENNEQTIENGTKITMTQGEKNLVSSITKDITEKEASKNIEVTRNTNDKENVR